jgi:radical SAM superfamily enzyme YgiQ (UPF0313 family)
VSLRRPRRPEDFREYTIVKNLSDREMDFNETRGNDVAFVFPSAYRVAASSLAFSWVRDLLSNFGVGIERFFFQDSFERFYSLESLRPIDEFRVIAFSYQFETDIFNILKILKKLRIPLKWDQRGDEHPLILVGGPVTYFNPISMAPIADVIYSGDLEPSAEDLASMLKLNRRSEIIDQAVKLSYLWVPPMGKEGFLIKMKDLNTFPPVGSIISPDGEFKNRLLMEIGRGCIRRCAFCMIGHVQKPARFLKVEVIKQILNGISRDIPIGIISATVTDYPWLDELLDLLEERNFSVSSMRMDGINLRLLKMLARHQKSFTVAPEGGTQRIRDILMKDINEEQIENTLKLGRKAGFNEIKMYFIYGLDEENEDDLKGIRDVVKFALNLGYKNVKVSLNPLIPKPGTPFHKRRMESVKVLNDKKNYISGILKINRVKVHFESIRESVVQYKVANMNYEEAIEFVEIFEKHGERALKRIIYDSFSKKG